MTHKFDSLYYVYDAGHRWGPPDATYTPGKWSARRVRPAVPPLVTREEVASKLHDEILVDAAVLIANKAYRHATYDIRVTLADFDSPVGFLRLLNYGAGWSFGASHMLQPSAKDPDAFEPTASFWDRLVGQSQEDEKKP